jgi:hypothetical protein
MCDERMAPFYVTNKGNKVRVTSKQQFSKAVKKGRVAAYVKGKSTDEKKSRCRAGFKARKGSRVCMNKALVHYKKDGSLDMRYNSSYK